MDTAPTQSPSEDKVCEVCAEPATTRDRYRARTERNPHICKRTFVCEWHFYCDQHAPTGDMTVSPGFHGRTVDPDGWSWMGLPKSPTAPREMTASELSYRTDFASNVGDLR